MAAKQAQELHGIGAVITRPDAQAHALAQLVEQAGGMAHVFPTLEIDFVSATSFEKQLHEVEAEDLLIFVSANAVRGLFDQLSSTQLASLERAHIAAVGTSTQAALERRGIEVNINSVADQQNSEGLMAHADMQDLAGQKVFIVRGQSGRETLAKGLRERGAEIHYIQTYTRRIPQTFDAKGLMRCLRLPSVRCVMLTSYEAFSNLLELLEADISMLLADKTLIVPSDRIAQKIGTSYPLKLIVADNASNAAMLAALSRV